MRVFNKIKLKYPLILLLFSLTLVGCTDLRYVSTEVYYKTLGETANMVFTKDGKDKKTSSYSIEKSLYNAKTSNEIRSDDPVDYEYYEYLAVQISVDKFEAEDVDLFIRTESEEVEPFVVNISVVEKIPDKVRGYDAPNTKYNEKTKQEELIDYDDRDLSVYGSTSMLVKSAAWRDFVIDEWHINEKRSVSLPVPKGYYILFQFLNNTGYGRDQGLKEVKFSLINLMISAYDPYDLSDLYGEDNNDDCNEEYYGEPEPYEN